MAGFADSHRRGPMRCFGDWLRARVGSPASGVLYLIFTAALGAFCLLGLSRAMTWGTARDMQIFEPPYQVRVRSVLYQDDLATLQAALDDALGQGMWSAVCVRKTVPILLSCDEFVINNRSDTFGRIDPAANQVYVQSYGVHSRLGAASSWIHWAGPNMVVEGSIDPAVVGPDPVIIDSQIAGLLGAHAGSTIHEEVDLPMPEETITISHDMVVDAVVLSSPDFNYAIASPWPEYDALMAQIGQPVASAGAYVGGLDATAAARAVEALNAAGLDAVLAESPTNARGQASPYSVSAEWRTLWLCLAGLVLLACFDARGMAVRMARRGVSWRHWHVLPLLAEGIVVIGALCGWAIGWARDQVLQVNPNDWYPAVYDIIRPQLLMMVAVAVAVVLMLRAVAAWLAMRRENRRLAVILDK